LVVVVSPGRWTSVLCFDVIEVDNGYLSYSLELRSHFSKCDFLITTTFLPLQFSFSSSVPAPGAFDSELMGWKFRKHKKDKAEMVQVLW